MQFLNILTDFVEKSSLFLLNIHIFIIDKCRFYWYIIAKGDDIHEFA